MYSTFENGIGKQINFILFFMLVTPITLLVTVFSLLTLTRSYKEEASSERVFFTPETRSFILAPLEIPSEMGFSESVIGADSRGEMLRKYLKRYDTPLYELADFIVKTSDKYSLDYRLLVAIAQKESGLCRVIPDESHNCWGWGIHSKGTLKFDSFEEGIETVSKGLKEKYVDKGYLTVEQIMEKYAHSSSTTWAEGVIGYMNDIQ